MTRTNLVLSYSKYCPFIFIVNVSKLIDLEEIENELLFWESKHPLPVLLKNEIKEWYQRWQNIPIGNILCLLDTLKQCDAMSILAFISCSSLAVHFL